MAEKAGRNMPKLSGHIFFEKIITLSRGGGYKEQNTKQAGKWRRGKGRRKENEEKGIPRTEQGLPHSRETAQKGRGHLT